MIVRGFNSAGIAEAVQNAEDIYKKIENSIREKFFIFVKLLVFFFKISLLKKKLFLVFLLLSNLTQIITVNFWTHLDKKLITSLLNKFEKWPLILVGLKSLSV